MRAMLSMLPVTKKTPSGDQAKSYISEPDDRHMCFIRHVSLSSKASSPNAWVWEWVSEGIQSSVLPSSPALASISTTFISKALDSIDIATYLAERIEQRSLLGCATRR